jgi:hypothetical protein
MQTRAYSICRRCAAVFPEGRRCPACEGDTVAAQEVAAATTYAVEAAQQARTHPHRTGALLITGVVAVSLVAGLGMLALAFV